MKATSTHKKSPANGKVKEELDLSNNELETSKEGKESAKQEQTTNQELQTRNDMLNESYDYVEAVLATIHEPMLVLDKNLRVKSANKTFYKTFNVKEKDTEGILLYDLGDRQWNIPRLRELLEELLPKNTHFHDFEITHTFPLIGEKTMLLNARRIIQKINNEELILLAISDVTEQASARRKIEDSEKRYNFMLMKSPFGFAVLKGKNMVITLANDSIKTFWGKGKDLEGKPLFDVMPELKDSAFPGLLDNVYTTGKPFYGEEMLAPILRNGRLKDVYFNFVYQPYLEADESISGVTIIAYEVTGAVMVKKALEAQRETEKNALKLVEETNKRYYTMLMESPFAFSVMKGKDMEVTLANDLIKEFWGKGNEVEGKTLLQLLPEMKDQPFPAMLDKVYTTGIPVYANEILVRLQHKDKMKERYFNVVYQPDPESDGTISGVITIAYDVTEMVLARKKIEDAVAERTLEISAANQELLRMNKELEAFNYVSSHDLQEPLRKIRTIAGRILEKENQNLSDSGKNYFHLMQNAAERMQTLIQDLLAFSHLSMADRKFENTNLNIIIEEIRKEFKDAIAEKNAVIEVKEICNVKVIPFQFRQLMQNLISNALKFSNPKIPPHIKISSVNITYSKINVENLTPHKEYCHISISDNGIGFEKEFAEKIFEVFQKLHGKEEYAGTGIGLAIVKKIVDNHNGIIIATSELHKGTIFDIYIPA